jgi:hypothetical protein
VKIHIFPLHENLKTGVGVSLGGDKKLLARGYLDVLTAFIRLLVSQQFA